MEERHYKKKSLLIVCNVLLTLLLLLTTAVTITLAVQQFIMNIGGNITFNATDVQATISAGQISNGTVADSANKMQQIVLTPENDGALEKATWEGLEITFNGLDDVIISFTVTNNHTESNLEMTLVTSYTQSTNMTISTRIDNSSKTSVIIPKQAEGNDNQVECEIIFHIENNLQSASIEGFSIEYAFENTEEEPTYAVSIDPSSSDMVTGVSLNNATAGQQVIVTANISDTVNEDYVIMSDGPLYYIENGSEEKVTINQTEGQYSFTMPANDITIGVEKYRRLDDFNFSGNAITGYTGSDTELTLPSYYETVSINSQDYTVEKNTGTQITEIGDNTFLNCSSLTSVIIPEGVTSIGRVAFGSSTSLTTITLPKSLNSIFSYVFSNCPLEKIVYNGSIEEWTKIDIIPGSDSSYANLFSSGAGLYIGDQLVTEITITSDVSDGVFYKYAYLEKVTLAADVNIGYAAFPGSALNEVVIEENVTSVSSSAFSGCDNLQTVDFGDNSQLQTIGSSAFSGCDNLQTVDFGDNSQLQSIGNSAFSRCTKLQTVDFGDNSQLQSIGDYAFQDCTNLTSITIPASVTSIGNDAFYGCDNLTSVTIESDDIYNAAIGTNTWSHAGGLLANAMTVKVLTSIVNENENSYLENSSNFTTSTDGEYTVFTKKV